MIARVLVVAARMLIGIFYRGVDVAGLERIPRHGPLVVVANHQNALVDPLLLLARVPRVLRPIAKAPLFRIPGLGSLLRSIGAIPVRRRHESEGGPDRNAAAFARVSELLAAGEAILLFPEGVSQPEPMLMPLRTGAARLVLGAEHLKGGALGVILLPVGLVYEEPGTFRTGRALMLVGTPVPTRDLIDRYTVDPEGTARALTDRIASALRALVVEAEDRRTFQLVAAISRLWQPAADGDAAAKAAWMRGVMEAYKALRREAPARVMRFRQELERYEKDRELAGFDERLPERYSVGLVARYAVREGGSLLLGAPLALWGVIVHGLPYQIPRLVVRAVTPEDDMVATVKLAAAIVAFPLCWAVEAWILGHVAGAWALTAFLFALAPSGFFALGWQERLRRFRGQVAGFLAFLFRPDLHQRFRERRRALRAELDALAHAAAVSRARS